MIGNWYWDEEELPAFKYEGKLPYEERDLDGRKIDLPDDPWVLLGNHQITVIAYMSGEFELLSGQRSWARLNQRKDRDLKYIAPWGKLNGEKNYNCGANQYAVTIEGREFLLGGNYAYQSEDLCISRTFGCGWINYDYNVSGISVSRRMEVIPSSTPKGGTSAFVLKVKIINTRETDSNIGYMECMGVRYRELQQQLLPEETVISKPKYSPCEKGPYAFVRIDSTALESVKPSREEISRYDYYPASPFFYDATGNGILKAQCDELRAEYKHRLMPGELFEIRLVIGYAMTGSQEDVKSIVSSLGDLTVDAAKLWKKLLPDFAWEKEEELRRELIWHAHVLEAMATYSEYYDETKIPQGTVYDYFSGQHAAARDHYQHALPLVYYNPGLAKSVLRYMMKRTTAFGEIRVIELGNGFAFNERYFTSDQQLYFFLLLTEYLETTKDYAFLEEMITPYPVKGMQEIPVWKLVKECFIFLRDVIGRGSHGLISLLNADWSSADTLETSVTKDNGLPYWGFPVYCAHPHAWILYCYFKLRQPIV